MGRRQLNTFFIVLLAAVLSFILSYDHPFFWDAVSKAGRANWIFQNDFSSLIVPEDINSGHPPLWITSLALVWKLLGQSLWASRLLLLLVNIGVSYQLIKLAAKVWNTQISFYWVLLVFTDPTLSAQSLSLNNDMLLLYFCLLGINALLANKVSLYTLALCGLLLTNLRGIYCCAALLLSHLAFIKLKKLSFNRKAIYAYSTAAIVLAGFLIYQYNELGWILFTENPKYAEHREMANFSTMAKNSAAYFKALSDFGRIALWVILVLLLIKIKNIRSWLAEKSVGTLVVLIVSFGGIFFFGIAFSNNPLGPRYLLLLYILIALLLIHTVALSVKNRGHQKLIFGSVLVFFLSGHFWIYPEQIAQGWDSSLAYLNYYELEQEMLEFINEEELQTNQIFTYLPMNSRNMSYLDFSSRDKSKSYPLTKLKERKFVLYSNLENKSSDAQIELYKQWIPVKKLNKRGVFLNLYQNPNFKD